MKSKRKKLRFAGNFPISHNDTETNPDDGKDGYIKAEQFYYFNKDKIDYIVIGSVKKEVFEALIEFIQELSVDIENIHENL